MENLIGNLDYNIPHLSYKEWLRCIKNKPIFKYKVVKYKGSEIKICTMSEEEKSEYEAFWLFHNNICKTGCFVGGEYISGWLYFHLNYFKIPVDSEEDRGSRNAALGDFRDNEYMIAHYLTEAVKNEKHLMIFGTRRFSKSVFIASRLAYRSFFYANTTSVGIFGSDSDMHEAGHYYKIFYDNKENCFSDVSIVGKFFDGTNDFNLGFKLSKGGDFEKISTVKTVNLGMGESPKATESLAGISPSETILDECGKFNFAERWSALLPAFETGFGLRCSAILTGTGGNIEASKTAESMFLHADIHNLLVVTFDDLKQKTNHFMYVQENDDKVSLFVPGAMSLAGGKKIEMPFSEYTKREKTKKELDELEGMSIKVTDWANAQTRINDIIEKEYQKSEKDGKKATMYYPKQPSDCFLHADGNPFDVVTAKEKQKYLIDNDLWGEAVQLRNTNGIIEVFPSSKKPCKEFPFKGGFYDAPIMIYERPQIIEGVKPKWGCYVGGYDGVRILEETNSSSMISLYIVKMINNAYRIVASYVTRPQNMQFAMEQCTLLIELYNAITLAEREDMSDLKAAMEKKNLMHLFSRELIFDKDPYANLKYNNRPFGQSAAKSNSKSHVMDAPVKYCREKTEILDESGEVEREIFGIENIDDPMLLEELIKFKKGGNFDRYISWAHALVMGEELVKTDRVPRINMRSMRDDERQKPSFKRPSRTERKKIVLNL